MEEDVADPRLFCKYSIGNLLSQGVFLFLSGEASRNGANNRAIHGPFYKENFSRLFGGMEWAHPDTADNLYRTINWEDVETVKTRMIRSLLSKKRINSFMGHFLVAIDATGMTSYDEQQREELVHKKSKGGKLTYLNIMLEAKIVTAEGLSISLASEPLSNQDIKDYQKQDCELKAFSRLAKKIKKLFPRLPICLLLDGLYPNETMFEVCEANRWKYIVNLKDGSLGNLQLDIQDTEQAKRIRFEQVVPVRQRKEVFYEMAQYECIEEGLNHKGHELYWVECYHPQFRRKPGRDKAELTRFTYLTNFKINKDKRIIKAIVRAGRLRWKIENEGFNTQKNRGYYLHHKFSRYSVSTLYVYYILLQIAHLINQLVLHSKPVVALKDRYKKLSIRYLWERLRHVMEDTVLCRDRLHQIKTTRLQIRLE